VKRGKLNDENWCAKIKFGTIRKEKLNYLSHVRDVTRMMMRMSMG
jgi:hypothetical protein